MDGLSARVAMCDRAPRYTPSTTRREAHTLDTQARYGRWQTAYRALKQQRPRMSDVWSARRIAKQAVAAGCHADTICKHMKAYSEITRAADQRLASPNHRSRGSR